MTYDELAVGEEEEQIDICIFEAGLHLTQRRVGGDYEDAGGAGAHDFRSGPDDESVCSSERLVLGTLASTRRRRRPRSAYDWISR